MIAFTGSNLVAHHECAAPCHAATARYIVVRGSPRMTGGMQDGGALRLPDDVRNDLEQVSGPSPQRAGADQGPLSPAQEALWILEKLEGSNALHNISLLLRLTGPLDVERLSAALDYQRLRHEALRTVIREIDGQLLQQVLPGDGTGSSLSAEPVQGELALEQLLRDESQRPVAITAEHLWRARLLRVGPEDHVLTLVLHQVISDAWSLHVLARDLAAHYSGVETVDSAPGSVRFIDVAATQRAHSHTLAGEASRRYWASRLADLTNIELPSDRPATGHIRSTGAVEQFDIPDRVNAALRVLSLQEQATPFMVQLAAFRLLLARISGSTDFGIGIPVANRRDAAVERVVGFMVNTLVLRVPLTDSMTFRELVGQVKRYHVEALAHQDTPFERLVEDLAPVREGSRHPLFQVAFAARNQPTAPILIDGVRVETLATHNGASRFDLTLEVTDSARGARGEIEYRTALFDRDTIARMAGHYVRLLSAALESPDIPVLSLPMLDQREQRMVLHDWNATTRPRPIAERLDELILAQCRRVPDAVALAGIHGTVTYSALAADLETTARSLRASGVDQGDPVGVLMRRSPRLITAALAIMRAGGVYLPLDPDWPEQRALSVARLAGARLILRHEGTQTLADPSPRSALGTVDPLAYILFTSGSTGEPKGVEIGQRSICNHLQWFNECVGMVPTDAMLFKTSPTFDASLVEMFAPLLVGARVVVARDQSELDPADLIRTVRDSAISILQGVPSAFRALLATGGLSQCPSLRYLVIGGEALDPELARSLKRALPDVRIGNFYGPTEVTIDATQHEITDYDAAVIPIGKPIANARCYVLNPRGQPQPVGVWGELYVSGLGVAHGYRNRPELTAANFLPDPFQDGERMYRTGDRTRWRIDGTLEFSGRRDGQVKIRGLRIELGEIESVLMQQPGLAIAVVVAAGDERPPGMTLTAFVVPTREATLDASTLRDAIALQLPRYMVPSRITFRDSIPLLPSGKPDRAALLRGLAPAAAPERVAPRTELEKALLELWKEQLNLAGAGIDDDFFELGGHSLSAFQLVNLIQQRLEKPCTLRMLFQYPTVRQLVQALETELKAVRESIVLPLQANGSRPPVYCICGIQLYRELAQHFAPDVPVHGVFLPWEEQVLDGSADASGITVEDLANRYIQAIRAAHPHGAFSLIGISFGGILAFEIARQLSEAGMTPPLVAILDMPPVELRRQPRFSPRHFYKEVSLWVRIRFYRLIANRLAAEALREHLNEERGMMYVQAMRSYRTRPYSGQVLVVQATRGQPISVSLDPALGWRDFVANVSAIDAPGDHLGILRGPGAQLIARTVRQWLP